MPFKVFSDFQLVSAAARTCLYRRQIKSVLTDSWDILEWIHLKVSNVQLARCQEFTAPKLPVHFDPQLEMRSGTAYLFEVTNNRAKLVKGIKCYCLMFRLYNDRCNLRLGRWLEKQTVGKQLVGYLMYCEPPVITDFSGHDFQSLRIFFWNIMY